MNALQCFWTPGYRLTEGVIVMPAAVHVAGDKSARDRRAVKSVERALPILVQATEPHAVPTQIVAPSARERST
ncbi:hypothetical protein [Saccharothrix coeruleofusca]|uniref:Uncharacterized protein n=1 Tax=Saccharothrix coeruleofusca TaxID=33919 RepID=A0A918AI82_9PSEU|nr:hypothetical protein [Saccharothrix coeruleofusca]MBP2333842.1 hypothetical protein [Saccharothrix coeruleofusca]GGP45416.1 hypothetical protein GCM10010185_16500 [Saccharothrix coeruleofusca]